MWEDADGWNWPSRWDSRRVAALTVTASLLAQTLPSSTTGGASRLAAATRSSSESIADSGSQFPVLLAGFVSTSEEAEGDSHAPVVAATATGKRSPERKTAGGNADSTEQSDAASKLGVPAAGPEQQAVMPTVSTLQMQPTLPSVT